MKDAKTMPWVLGAAFLAVVILAGMWFLAVSPELEAAADSREQAESQRSNNDLLRVQNAKLAKQAEELPAMRLELEKYRVGIPDAIEQAAFNDELARLIEATGAFVLDVEWATSALITPETAGPAVPVPAGMYAIPVTVTVLGSPDDTIGYLDALQKGTQRHFFVSTMAAEGQDEEGASGGRPATRAGDLQIAIAGYVYVLADGSLPTETAPAGAATSEPVAPAN